MKKCTLFACLLIFMLSAVKAQTSHYTSASSEMIFSFAKIKKNGSEIGSNLRWSPVFNIQVLRNHNFTQHFGLFHGFAIRNVGFIYDIPGTDTLKKFRTYNLGIPLGFKLGNINNGFFLYGGYEFEIPFNYKEKTFIGERKEDKFSVWFSDRTDWWTQSVFAGINFRGGFNIKFKYYLNNFFNKSFYETRTENGLAVKYEPFKDFNANVFYISIDWNVFKALRGGNKTTPKPQQGTGYSYNY
jgi:hypothetical protein